MHDWGHTWDSGWLVSFMPHHQLNIPFQHWDWLHLHSCASDAWAAWMVRSGSDAPSVNSDSTRVAQSRKTQANICPRAGKEHPDLQRFFQQTWQVSCAQLKSKQNKSWKSTKQRESLQVIQCGETPVTNQKSVLDRLIFISTLCGFFRKLLLFCQNAVKQMTQKIMKQAKQVHGSFECVPCGKVFFLSFIVDIFAVAQVEHCQLWCILTICCSARKQKSFVVLWYLLHHLHSGKLLCKEPVCARKKSAVQLTSMSSAVIGMIRKWLEKTTGNRSCKILNCALEGSEWMRNLRESSAVFYRKQSTHYKCWFSISHQWADFGRNS